MLIGLCDRTERPFQNQNKGIFRPDKKAAYLLYPGGAFRSAAFLFMILCQGKVQIKNDFFPSCQHT